MALSTIRTRPLIAVLTRVPLFVEAMRAAFKGIADVQPVSVDGSEAQGLVRAFRPDAVIFEGTELDVTDLVVPCVHVDLVSQSVSLCSSGTWESLDIEVSPEAIRNVTVAALYGGHRT